MEKFGVVRVVKSGTSSSAVFIPKELAQLLNLKHGQKLLISYSKRDSDFKLVLEPFK